MSFDVTRIVEGVASGDPDRVDDAIDRVTALDAVDRFGLYDDLFAACQEVAEDGDAATRQAVTRLLRDAYPGLEARLGSGEIDAVDGVRLADTTAQRHRYVEFLLDALDDDDDIVRAAAVAGVDSLASGMAAAELGAETEALQDVLSELAVRQPEAKRRHTEQAIRTVGRPGIDEAMADIEFRIAD